ncbi:DUF3267 domain-containing protein [Carnobacterium maltaromaticum]|uniref:DUF3267 domain-containing protein n=1 Tax=Carnobacterium maltaromaticum TaxID=2751 RepID=UPI0039AF008F
MKKELILYKKVNLIENRPLLQLLSRLSLTIFLLLLLVPVGYIYIAMNDSVLKNELSFFDFNAKTNLVRITLFLSEKLIGIILLFFISLVLHEAIHGLFFKVFGAKKVTFGFKRGMAYAEASGSCFRAWQFKVIALSPFVGLSLLYLILAQYIPISAFLLFALHTSGCVGDFYFIYLLIKFKEIDWIEDTETGINLYKKN